MIMSYETKTRVEAATVESPARRRVLAAGAAMALAPAFIPRPARAATGQVIIRSPGGVLDEAFRKSTCDPFTQETGIEVVMVPATTGKMLAMFASGNVELDVLDIELAPLLTLARQDALAPINYDQWKFTNPSSLDANIRHPTYVGNYFFSTGMGYNTQAYPTGTQPKSWADFWDLTRFPGARTLPSIQTGVVALEAALLADGVPADKIYPIDVDRAFKSLDRIRPSIRKYWDAGAASMQMLTEKEVVLGSFYSGRVQAAKDAGATVEIEWNQQMLQAQVFAVFKGAKNLENARKFIDFAVQPKIQAAYFTLYNYGPSNTAALKLMAPAIVERLPNSPEHLAKAFRMDAVWWDENRPAVSNRWSQWLLRKS
jgi:putative spermidine/putrescine transport system substrate-binding protein